jgi:hypothetical protein
MIMYQNAATLIALAIFDVSPVSAAPGPYAQLFGGPNFLPSYEFELDDQLGAIDPD